MSTRILLDDAAAVAMADVRIDLVDAHRRADQRQAVTRHRAVSVMTAAAAAVAAFALFVVLVPSVLRSDAVQPAEPDSGPVGLPRHWFYSPPWTPPVTRHPMAAASMILEVPLAIGVLRRNSISGPVLVSADGKTYASLPWGPDDSQVALSRDGLRVAWVTLTEGSRPVVHRIELATGRQQDAELATTGDARIGQLVWAGTSLYAAAVGTTDQDRSTWRLPATGGPVRVCRCANPPLAADGQGNLLQPAPETGRITGGTIPGVAFSSLLKPSRVPAAYSAGSSPDGDDLVSSPTVLDATGRQLAVVVGGGEPAKYDLSVGEKLIPVVGGNGVDAKSQVDGADVLGWALGGVVVRMHFAGLGPTQALRLYDPSTGSYRKVSTRSGSAVAVAVASDVVGEGQPLAQLPVQPSTSDRSHVRFLVGRGWAAYGSYLEFLAFALVLAAILLMAHRRGMFSLARDGRGDRQELGR